MRSVSTTRHISTSCCQSRLLRAKRDTSRAATAPTLPRQTSATMRSKPARATPPAAEVLVDDLDFRPTQPQQPLAHRVLQRSAFAVVQDLVGRGLADVEHRLARQVPRADLVSAHRGHPRPSVRRRRRTRRAGGPSARSAPAASDPARRPTRAPRPAPAAGPPGGVRAGAAAPGAGEEGVAWRSPRWCAGGATAAARIASASSDRSAARAESAATGSGASRTPRQAAASSIQAGISRIRTASAPARLHRARAPVGLPIASWTRTDCPAHGCQAYATIASSAASVPWVLGRRVLQSPAPALRPRLLDPGPGLRADGRGQVTHLTRLSTPAGQAQPRPSPLVWTSGAAVKRLSG